MEVGRWMTRAQRPQHSTTHTPLLLAAAQAQWSSEQDSRQHDPPVFLWRYSSTWLSYSRTNCFCCSSKP